MESFDMSAISPINLSNLYSLASNPLQDGSQASGSTNAAATASGTNSASSISPEDVVQLSYLQAQELSSSLLNPSGTYSPESLILSMQNLQSIEQTGAMKNDPALASSLLTASQSPSSLESLASSMSLLSLVDPSTLIGTNSDPLQYLLNGTVPSLANLNNSASADSGAANNTATSSSLPTPYAAAASAQSYLANALLSEAQNSTLNQVI
jgi:hypothetical protein